MADDKENSEKAAAAPALPDFYTDPNAVLKDDTAVWRFGKRPDYAKTRQVYKESKRSNHAAGSLPDLVENLVKNWEIEASFKTRLEDWRTINHKQYSFAMNGGESSDVGYMLKQGTYNAILPSNDYYCPAHNDMSVSHKTFKRMMPTFAWEVLEVYSGPPKVAFRWRHWGWMKNDYNAYNNKGERVTAKAHNNIIDIEGVTVADLDETMHVVHLETWFDPMTMFGQIAPNGVTKVPGSSSSDSGVQGTEDDSAKREYGTHPEDPKPDAPEDKFVAGEKPPTGNSSTASSEMPHGNMGSDASGCPFMKSG